MTEYLQPTRMIPTFSFTNNTVGALYTTTLLTTYGLYRFNTNDVGITEFLKRLWNPKQAKKE